MMRCDDGCDVAVSVQTVSATFNALALMQILLATLPKLPHVITLLVLTMLMIAIVGVQLFMGDLRRRCYTADHNEYFKCSAAYCPATVW